MEKHAVGRDQGARVAGAMLIEQRLHAGRGRNGGTGSRWRGKAAPVQAGVGKLVHEHEVARPDQAGMIPILAR